MSASGSGQDGVVEHIPGASMWQCRHCPECLRARRRQQKLYLRRVARTGPARVPCGPVSDVVEQWEAEGFGSPVIGAAAGLSRTLLYSIAERQQPNVQRRVAAVIRHLDRDDLYAAVRGREFVPAVGTRRRLQALAWAGWDTAGRGVLSEAVWRRVANPPLDAAARKGRAPKLRYQQRVFAGTHWAVRSAFQELSLQQGPSGWHAALARDRGWAPGLAWDSDSIDDPQARPVGVDRGRWLGRAGDVVDDIAVELMLAGTPPKRSTIGERAEAVRVLTDRGHGPQYIAEHVGIDVRSVERIRSSARQAEAA